MEKMKKVRPIAISAIMLLSMLALVPTAGAGIKVTQILKGYQITQITNNRYNDVLPEIDEGKVVWSCSDGDDSEIFFCDLAAGYENDSAIEGITPIIQITNNNYTDYWPEIDEDKIVWYWFDEVYEDGVAAHDLATGETTQLHDNCGTHDPKIDEGKIVWFGDDSIEHDFEIYLAMPIEEPGRLCLTIPFCARFS